jgi:CHAT domain-containing protein
VIGTVLLAGVVVFLAAQSASPAAPSRQYGSACPSAASGAELLEAARDLRAKGDAEGQLHCYARAAEQAAALGDIGVEADTRLKLAQAAFGAARLDLAAAQAVAARELLERQGDGVRAAVMTRLLGSVAYERGNFTEAERHYTAALDGLTVLAAPRERVHALLGLARVEKASRATRLEEALALARDIADAQLEGMALHLRSDWHFSAGRFDAAVTDLLRAIDLLERAGDLRQLAHACVSLGRLMRAHGRYTEALRYYDRAIALQEKTGDLRGRIQSTNAKAIALSFLGRTVESRAANERALALARETGVQRLVDFQLGNLAGVYTDEGDYPRAIRLLEDVLTREKDPYLLAYRHGSLAYNLLKAKDAPAALPHVQRAIAFAKQSENNDYLPHLTNYAAQIYGAMGQSAEALAAASEGVQILERVRARLVPLDFMKRGFADRWQELYGTTIGILHQGGDHEQALTTSEQARARAFLDLLASRQLVDRDASVAAPAGVDLRQGGASSQAVVRAGTAAEIAATSARLSSTILSYWVTDDDVFIWVTAPGRPTRATRVAVKRKELERLVAASLPRPGRKTTQPLGRLHALLIAPVREWLPRTTSLTIVPHGPLFRVSFAALVDTRGVYLIERHAIAYAPSISTLEFTARRVAAAKAADAARYLLIADPSPMPAATPPLAALPAARRETSAIARLVGLQRAVLLNGPRAAESGVRGSLTHARVVHFATHGVIRDDEPFESYLALGSGAPGTSSDGRLTVGELYSLELNAELVVLSACSTATGPPSGDGISGLSRALFYAGASSVLATLWDVADEPSAMLMAGFYRHWQGGMSKRASLRQAQLDLLRALRAGTIKVKTGPGTVALDEQPHYWAAYILVGEQ